MDLPANGDLAPSKSSEPQGAALALKLARNAAPFHSEPGGASPLERDSYTSTALAEVLDRATHASMAKATMGLSPASLMGAYLDWLTHLTASPGKRLQLVEKSFRKVLRLQRYAMTCAVRGAGNDGSASLCVEPRLGGTTLLTRSMDMTYWAMGYFPGMQKSKAQLYPTWRGDAEPGTFSRTRVGATRCCRPP